MMLNTSYSTALEIKLYLLELKLLFNKHLVFRRDYFGL